ncbi:biotin transporter BioY [Kineococcus endophyticus]|uniref:Biotin transporter n=1 Tax=Kineococcus endophyticus TaxID=1181883 RepID=A0ABV3PC92_9ACTN
MRPVQRSTSRDVALIATFAAVIVVLGAPGQLPLFGSAVPITLQTLGVMLAGALLGARRGALAVLVVLVLCAAGLPVLAGGRGGLSVFAGPSVGYLLGWPLGAALTGWLTARRPSNQPQWFFTAALAGGIGVVYLIGVPLQVWITQLPAWTSVMFLPGDLLKAALTAFVASGVHRARPELLPLRRRRTTTSV